MKRIYSGLEGSGKSLEIARLMPDIVERNAKWSKEIGKPRPIWSNMYFSADFEHYAEGKGVPIIYWQNLDDLIKIRDADVIIDEVGNYFDSRLWGDLSLDARRWLTQGSKCGIEIYGTAQDFAQIDKAFRRLVNELYEIRKLWGSPRPSATKPPIKRIWGICVVYSMDPQGYDEDNKTAGRGIIPSGWFTIRKKHCKIFDTGQRIERSKPTALKHETKYCEHHEMMGGDGRCTFCKTTHF